MTTEEVANKWAEYCQTGRYEEAHTELYDSKCISLETEGVKGFPEKAVGMSAIKKKGEQWSQMIEQLHSTEIEGPIVAANYFSATMKMDVTMKGIPRHVSSQVAVFQVEDGKIVKEQFFYPVNY